LSTRNSHFVYRTSRPLLLSFIVFFFLVILSPDKSHPANGESCVLPDDYGKVVCRYNEESPNQVYIIGIAHRDSLTRSNGSCTPRVQAEVYKIGEWLIQNQKVELLLPEGFFTVYAKKATEKTVRSGSLPTTYREGSMEILERRFSDDRQFVNAEMLLKEDFPLLLRQVEDKDLYQTVFESIRLLAESKGSMENKFLIRSEIDYHQKKRVGTMLQRIPGIVDDEFRQGHIDNKRALFTIGLSHISDIIRYLEERKITVLSPFFTSAKHEDYVDELNLAKEDFGISVIIPKTLASDPEVMARNNLKAF
jgi:hypothetical protein